MCVIKLSSLLFFILLYVNTNSQLVITSQECYGTSASDYFGEAISITDGGFLVSSTYNGTDGDAEGQDSLLVPAQLMKFDVNLNLLWQKNFGGNTGNSVFNTLIEVSDGYICGGYSYAEDGDFADNNGANDFIVVKVDFTGNKIWSYCYGGYLDDYLVGMIAVSDGGLLLTGKSLGAGGDIPYHYGDPFSPDVTIIKLNGDGEIQWLKVYGGRFVDAPLANPVEVDSGVYQIHIYSASDDHDLLDCGILDVQKRWIVEINNYGDIIKESFMSAEDDFYRSDGQLMLLDDKTTIMIGSGNAESTLFPAPDGHMLEEEAIAKFDTNLALIDMKLYGGSGSDKFLRCKKDIDGNFFLLGISSSDDLDLPNNYNNGLGSDYWIVKTDSLLNIVWSQNFGGSAHDGELAGSYFEGNFLISNNYLYLFSKCVVPENLPDYDISCGHEPPNDIIPYTDAWLVTFDIGTTIESYNTADNPFNLYPNPADDILTIEMDKYQNDLIIYIYDITSTCIYSNFIGNSSKVSITTSHFSNGIYFVSIIFKSEILYSDKFIIQH